MVIFGNFKTTMKEKQSMLILVYKDNYDTVTTTANKSIGFDLNAIQSCLYPTVDAVREKLEEKSMGFSI